MNLLRMIIALRCRQTLDEWRVLFPNCSISPLEFYALLEAAVRVRQVPDIEISQKDYKEGNLLSDRRLYMRIARDRSLFDCCAIPFGTSYLFSYWLLYLPHPFKLFHFLGMFTAVGLLPILSVQTFGFSRGLLLLGVLCAALLFVVKAGAARSSRALQEFLLGLSIIGVVWELFFRLPTHFERDTTLAFHSIIHECYMEVLSGLSQPHGLRALTQDERRKPKMRDFYQK